ncbi:hypothetical protein BDA96_03G415100 [Sorghum bicolor]|uniref:Uncharacterized protein n=2 Tax=Sorghum bicolor TaxID=4558 RepID=A0A921UQA2_SORBI|nr:hypothetical protein BDA96_03G415100 [Sorghum bicolor]OQU88019.1 hypothetical protein SORBI_3003G384750 [Sorghum bicolor]
MQWRGELEEDGYARAQGGTMKPMDAGWRFALSWLVANMATTTGLQSSGHVALASLRFGVCRAE